MNPLTDLVTRARAHGLKMADICSEAGIQAAQASRWRHGKVRPLYESVERLEEALARLIERQYAGQAGAGEGDAPTSESPAVEPPTELDPVGVLAGQVGAPPSPGDTPPQA